MFLLYHGEDSFVSLVEAKKKLEELKKENNGAIVVSIDVDSSEPETVISKISSTDMFSTGKVVFLKRTIKNRKKEVLIEALMELAENSTTPPLIFWEDHKVNGVTRYFKFFKKNNAIVQFDQMRKPGFVKWATEQLENQGLKGSRESVYELAQRVNFQTERLVNEVEKLVLAGVKEVDSKLLQKNTSDTLEFDIWKLMDAINAGNREETLEITESLLSNGDDPHYILAMLARNTRLLVGAKHLTEKGANNREIASKLRVPPFTVGSLLSSAKRSSMTKLKSVYEKLASLDFEIKVGNIDPQLGLTLLMAKL